MISSSKLLSNKVRSLPPSGMTAFFALAPDVISLGLGEPGFSTPLSIGNGGIDAIRNGKTFYPPSNGYPDVREKVAEYLLRAFQYTYSPSEVLLTSGASTSLDAIIRTYVDLGDEVIIPAPAYGYYASLTHLSGGVPVLIPTCAKHDWTLTAENLRNAITPRTKMLILNYPNNPTGATLTPTQFAAIADVLRDTDILVISDEIYAENIYCSSHASIIHQPDMRERTLLVSGFSKSMAMTGWRIGYTCAPQDLLEPVIAVNAVATLCVSGIAQAAALEGLTHGQQDIEYMNQAYKIRRDYAFERVLELGWIPFTPKGSFYLWCNIASTGMDADTLSRELIDKAKVAVLPGTLFGSLYSDYVRLSFSPSMEQLKEAFDRITEYIAPDRAPAQERLSDITRSCPDHTFRPSHSLTQRRKELEYAL